MSSKYVKVAHNSQGKSMREKTYKLSAIYLQFSYDNNPHKKNTKREWGIISQRNLYKKNSKIRWNITSYIRFTCMRPTEPN